MGGSAARKRLTEGVPRTVQHAVTAAEKEIAGLACEIDRRQKRIEKLKSFIDSCRIFDGLEETQTGTYAQAAMRILEAQGCPMSVPALVDALAASGRPVNGATRRQRVTILAISLKRERSLQRTPKGYWLRGVPMPAGSAHGS